ncbi:MAG: hypothetical protein FWG26_06960 [Betaproteobacteria bacterium]|nr:hypothetical protein [Betaproteobacteria bacterium]
MGSAFIAFDLSVTLTMLYDTWIIRSFRFTMTTRRIIVLLAGILAFFCLPLISSAAPPKASSRTVRPAHQNSAPAVMNIEAEINEYRGAEQELNSQIDELRTELLERAPQTLSGEHELIQRLQARIHELEKERKELQKRLEQPRSNASLNWVLGGAAFFTLALCVILLLRMNRTKTFDEPWAQEEPAALEEASSSPFGLAPSVPATATEAEPPRAHPAIPTLPDWDSASPALDLQSLKALAAEENIEDRDSTIELAEIMLSFGRINSAAEALSNFIENNPKEAFVPWLKLLEVYRANGQRTEFDKIAAKLNKTFNIWTVDWDNFSDALIPLHGLETTMHVVKRLQELWGTRECQAYLQYLLRDTRDETRRGFSLAAIDDILCLSDILEQCLGPYTGPSSAFDSDLLSASPLTETE